MSVKLFRIVVGLVVALLPGVALAQTGTITGLVRDSSGAAAPGATVRVVAEASGRTVEAVTNDQGSRASVSFAVISPTPRRCACAASSSTAAPG